MRTAWLLVASLLAATLVSCAPTASSPGTVQGTNFLSPGQRWQVTAERAGVSYIVELGDKPIEQGNNYAMYEDRRGRHQEMSYANFISVLSRGSQSLMTTWLGGLDQNETNVGICVVPNVQESDGPTFMGLHVTGITKTTAFLEKRVMQSPDPCTITLLK